MNKEWALQCAVCYYVEEGDTKDGDFVIGGISLCVKHVDYVDDDVLARAVAYGRELKAKEVPDDSSDSDRA